jgi:four helix bundle protein
VESERSVVEGVNMASVNYQDLIAWQKSMDLVEAVYRVTAEFPRTEIYGLRAQLRRAAISIPSNFAEGEGRRSKREFYHFLTIAHGSIRELETQTLIAERLSYITPDTRAQVLRASSEVGRLLTGLSNSLRNREKP